MIYFIFLSWRVVFGMTYFLLSRYCFFIAYVYLTLTNFIVFKSVFYSTGFFDRIGFFV